MLDALGTAREVRIPLRIPRTYVQHEDADKNPQHDPEARTSSGQRPEL